MICCIVLHLLSTAAIVGAYQHELRWGSHDFVFQAKWMARTGLIVDILANLVNTYVGSILTFEYDFTSLVAYILLVVGAFGALHVSLYEMK